MPLRHGPSQDFSGGQYTTSGHPIPSLVAHARTEFERTRSSQSRSLKEATAEYRRRYKLPPPPHFDRWYDFVVENNVQLVDEYDQIHRDLLPFWGLAPQVLRGRATRAIRTDNFLMAVRIRNGKVDSVERGNEWQQEAIGGMIEKFVRYLPDMDLAFNLHDEARVVLPHEDLRRLVVRADTEVIPQASIVASPVSIWSWSPSDLLESPIRPDPTSPFKEYAHQFTWTDSRVSCPEDTPARMLNYDGSPSPDQVSAYGVGELGFVYNKTALTDICLSPSLRETWGFFNRPNAFSVTHELTPIFTPSKMSSFQDILYPSPWYWADKVILNATRDMPWDEKVDTMYWRGTTTSGYSRNGTWHRQHRQRLVEQINKPGRGKIMKKIANIDGDQESGPPSNQSRTSTWVVQEVERTDYSSLFDVHLTFAGQCAPDDCEEQRVYFETEQYPDEDYQLAWRHKYLLDVDGNAFSGRFHTFLKSNSLTFKLAMFREWHDEWLWPWAHFVPWSVEQDDHLESVRFFNDDNDAGRRLAREIAADSTAWAEKVLRHVDLEAWMFRMLLE